MIYEEMKMTKQEIEMGDKFCLKDHYVVLPTEHYSLPINEDAHKELTSLLIQDMQKPT